MAHLAQYHSRYHAKLIDPRTGNKGDHLDFAPTANTLSAVEPDLHGIGNDLLLARLTLTSPHESRDGSYCALRIWRTGFAMETGTL